MPINVPQPVTLTEAQQLLAMPMLLPDEEILGSYELEHVEIMYDDLRDIYHWVAMTYQDEDKHLLIIQEKLPEDFVRTIEFDRESALLKQTKVGQHDAYTVVYPDHGNVKIEWIIDDRLLMITGKMSEEYAFEIANSLR